jgi:hypothetical protein
VPSAAEGAGVGGWLRSGSRTACGPAHSDDYPSFDIMSKPKTSEERTAASRAAISSATAFAVRYEDFLAPTPSAPPPFDGEWVHSTYVGAQILAGGWKPELVKNTIYGAAICLSRKKWDPAHPDVIRCVLALTPAEVLSSFKSQWATGAGQNEVMWYLKDGGLRVGRNPSLGTSTQNQRIARFFLEKGIKAICFEEHGTQAVAVYDPDCIRIIP